MVIRTYKFRLYPNIEQEKALHRTLGACRWTYNKMVEKIHREGFQSRNELCYFLTELKESEKWLYDHHSKMLQMVSTQIDGAQNALIQLRKNGHKTGDLKFARFSEYRNFAYDSDGCQTPNPLNLQKMLRPLARIQRKISRRQKGSARYKKAVRFYQIIHERIRNKRRDFLHKLSTQYSRKYDVVFLERLQKLNMVKNHKLARNVLDSGWGTFGTMLDYKCVKIEILPKNTTVDCSECGNAVPKSLAVRTHRCNTCGLVLDRDHNAAINILKKGLDIFGLSPQTTISVPQELRELTPVEISMRSRKQEAPSFSEG